MSASRTSALLIIAALGLTACGNDDAGEILPEPVADQQSVADEQAAVEIGRANVGGPVVDPKPAAIDRVEVAESSPEQIVITFTAGDTNCTAADAVASADSDEVVVELFVGITEDALTRSCLAGDVEQTISIALDEPLAGRDLVVAEPTDTTGDEPAAAPLPGDGTVEAMAEAIVGLDVETAERQVVEAGWQFRLAEVEGQPQELEEDLRDNRINVWVEDGRIVDAQVF